MWRILTLWSRFQSTPPRGGRPARQVVLVIGSRGVIRAGLWILQQHPGGGDPQVGPEPDIPRLLIVLH